MSRLADAIKEKCVKPEVERKSSITIGTIVEYDHKSHTVRLTYTNPKTGAIIEVGNVLFSLGPAGFVGRDPKPGERVLISFAGDTSTNPIIIQFIDEDYENKRKVLTKHDRQGAFLPDHFCAR